MSYAAMIGGIVSAYGQEVESKAAEKAMEYNRKVALRNASIAQQNAEYDAKLAERDGEIARAAAAIRADDVRREAERVQHEGRQMAGAGGLVPSEGSPLLVELSTRTEGEIAAQREEYNGLLAEMATKDAAAQSRYIGALQARAFRQEAKLTKFGIKLEQRTRFIKGAATVLGASYSSRGVGGASAGGTQAGAGSGGYSSASLTAQSWGYM